MLIAQLTDTHLKDAGKLAYRQVDTSECLRRAISHLNALRPRPDIVLMTGDITDDGTSSQFGHALDLLAELQIPLLAIPGNHDEREALQTAFPKPASQEPSGTHCFVSDDHPVRIVMLDTTVPKQSHGILDAPRLAWLQLMLEAERERPTLIAMHHPPFKTGIRHMDRQNCGNADKLAEILVDQPQVVGIVCGHIHRTIVTRFASKPATIAPSPAHSVVLDLNPDGPSCFNQEPPAVHLHFWQPDDTPYGRLTTHTSFIGDYGNHYPFRNPDGSLID